MFFDRRAQLTINSQFKLSPTQLQKDSLNTTALRIVFDVKKTIASNQGNTANITMYNPKLSTIQQVEGIGRKDNKVTVQLLAGYVGNILGVYEGDITFVNIERTPPDIKLMMQMETSKDELRTHDTSQLFKRGSSIYKAFQEVLGGTKLKLDSPKEIFTFVFGKDSTFEGKTEEVLTKISKLLGSDWINNDGLVSLISANGTGLSIDISPKTGLVGSPVKTKTGVNFRHLLYPPISCGMRVNLTSINYPQNLPLKILTVTHKGDTHGNDWYTDVEAEYVK